MTDNAHHLAKYRRASSNSGDSFPRSQTIQSTRSHSSHALRGSSANRRRYAAPLGQGSRSKTESVSEVVVTGAPWLARLVCFLSPYKARKCIAENNHQCIQALSLPPPAPP